MDCDGRKLLWKGILYRFSFLAGMRDRHCYQESDVELLHKTLTFGIDCNDFFLVHSCAEEVQKLLFPKNPVIKHKIWIKWVYFMSIINFSIEKKVIKCWVLIRWANFHGFVLEFVLCQLISSFKLCMNKRLCWKSICQRINTWD